MVKQRTSTTSYPRQATPARYLRREKLQHLLERLFPTHPDLNFHIRVDEDIWSFDAPHKVSEEQLKEASE
ncbi:hypothetical protein EYZ11_004616 [Aspergillus tanneri]|uniref:Uncharacterized protein n=1 Tax=Aspergillus tanneri TaxID=1220188 RepID=A0A4S3JKH7_9EURO|nr:uncharacterized protein ATNIH1004_009250 [Aspergillus tanneri]KAA8645039.1 hypothetical protein ATNIH1004_009250 [Aspergillus tanneri]THC95885.1 hypothetical protein EYZ11_004616 [Aspergillus tanneri]